VCPGCGKTTKFRLSAWFNNKVNGMLSINFLEDSKIEKKIYPHQKAPQQRDDVPDRYKFNKTPVQADPPYSDDDGSDMDNMPF
jgi:hypothetical protein